MKIIQIRNRWDNSVIFEGEFGSLRLAVEEAVRRGISLRGANLSGAKISWQSHAMLSEILWRAADGNQQREMLASYIGRKIKWCWPDWLKLEHKDREWALRELAKWVGPDDDHPEVLDQYCGVAP